MRVANRTGSHAWLRLVAIGAVVSVLAGGVTAGIKEAAAAELPPMPQPVRDVGFKWMGLKNGEDFTITLLAKTADTESWKTSDGCWWTRPTTSSFAPALTWSGCDFDDGRQTVRLEGEEWPLQVGKKWSYAMSGDNDAGYSWNEKHRCKVKRIERIKTRLGEYDTYKVVCSDRLRTRTWYVSPSLQTSVRYINNSYQWGRSVYDLIKVVKPKATP